METDRQEAWAGRYLDAAMPADAVTKRPETGRRAATSGVERAGDKLFVHVEDFVAREMARPARTDTTAPKPAGGAV